MSRRRPSVALLALLAAGAAAAQAPAAEPRPAAPDRTFEGTADVVRVEVPVSVVDRRGEPVRGLTAADFVLVDEGTQRELVGFDVVDLDFTPVPEHADAETLATVLPPAARRHFLFLFDYSFSSSSAILRAREAARELVLHALHPSDLAAVAVYSLETGPELVLTFTPDRAALARAIDNLGFEWHRQTAADPLRFIPPPIMDPTSAGPGETSDRNEIKAQIQEIATESARIVSKQIERGQIAYERSRVSAWSRALGEMAELLDAVPARKHVIYFSEGFDGELLLGKRYEPGSLESEQALLDRMRGQLWMVDNDDLTGNTRLQGDVGAMLRAFRRSDCVIQAVDIGGLRGNLDPTRNKASQDALFFIANETGGELFEDANDLGRQLERVLQRSTVTYMLSFEPRGLALDGRYHRLEVRLPGRKGIRVSHRPGYFEPRPFREMHPLEKSLLASEAIASATPREEVRIEVLAAPFRAGDAAYVPVIVEIDGESLVRGQESEALEVEVYAYATDAKGQMRDFFAQSIALDPGPMRARLLATGLKYYGHLELAAGEHLVRVLVRNAVTGRAGVATLPLPIPAAGDTELALLPPFFIEDPQKWLLVREPSAGGDAGSVVYPFTVNGEPYVPAARPALEMGKRAELCLVAYHLGSVTPALQAWVVDAEGRSAPGGELFLVERTVTGITGVDKLLAEFRPRHLAAGDYTLMVAMVDPVTGLESQSSIPISVVR